MRRRRFLGLVMIAMAVFITGVASLGVLEDDDEADGLAGVASCRTGPAAEGEPEWDELPGWTADALDAAVPDDATCRELSFAKTADEELASLHLRVEAPGGSVGIDAERLGGSVDEYRAVLPFELAEQPGGLYRANGQDLWYAFPERDGAVWALSATGDERRAPAVLSDLTLSWGTSAR